MKILVTPTSMTPDHNSRALMRPEVTVKPCLQFSGRPLEGQELMDCLKGCDGYLAGLDFITSEILESCPTLKSHLPLRCRL